MSQIVEQVSFCVTGEFVTETARVWFWAEQKPYNKVEEFLLTCMRGTTLEHSVLLALIRDVLLGRRKFIGNTRDGSYCMVDDNTDIRFQFANIQIINTFADVERLLDANIRNQEYAETRESVRKFNQDDYGWVSPKGEFFAVPFAHHQEWAREYVIEHFSSEDRKAFYDKHTGVSWDRWGDFLCARGWVLLHNTQHGAAQMTRFEERPLTKAQKEFLFDYFMLRNRAKDASALYEKG